VSISFDGYEDLHPDHLYRRLDLFRSMREMRERLQNPATFAEAAAELRAASAEHRSAESASDLGASGPEPASRHGGFAEPAAPGDQQAVTEFELLLGRRPPRADLPPRAHAAPGASASVPGVQSFLQRLMEPYVVSTPDPSQPLLLAATDQAISHALRAVLWHPAFRRLEAAWAGLSRLVRNIESDETLQVSVLDISAGELATDLDRNDLHESALYHTLIGSQEVIETPPWSFWAADFEFGSTSADLKTLGAFGTLAAQAGAPVVAGASPALAGISSFSAQPDPRTWRELEGELAMTWTALRRSSQAPWIGLAAPRILLRLPYGPNTDPLETIGFDEMPTPEPAQYLWGNPSLAIAQLTAMAFTDQGPRFSAPDGADIGNLPVHIHVDGSGERVAQATAEAFLPERTARMLSEQGLMPVLSIRGRDAARLVRVQSIADPVAPLFGPWS
jgi:type VI secretion system protein ImpC